MIKIDVSKAIPPRLGTYLLGIIPGVFFETSIAIGNPYFAASVIARVHEIYPFGPYTLLALFLASSLLIGQGFFLLAWIADLLITTIFVLWRYAIRVTFGSQWIYRFFGKLQGNPPKQNRFIRLLSRLIFWARRREFSLKARPVLKCLHIAVRRLLKVRYGVETTHHLQSDDSEWGVWYSVLGEPLKRFQEGYMASRTALGCGFAGLTALYALPALRGKYFIALSLVFTFAGCFGIVDLLRWRIDPVKSTTARLLSVLLELRQATDVSERQDSNSMPVAMEADGE